MASISGLRNKVGMIKGYLKESKRIEQQYANMERHMYKQQEECLLDDDEELFV